MREPRALLAATTALALTACAHCGAGVEGPPTAEPDIDLEQAAWLATTPDGAVAAGSWRSFEDPLLLDLVDRAVRNSPTVESAALALQQAQIQLRGARVQAGPTGRVGGPDVSVSQSDQGDWNGQIFGSASASYLVDLWGENARAVERSELSVDDAEDQLISSRISIASGVVNTYIALRVLDAQIALNREQLAITERQLEVAEVRVRAGVSTRLAVNQFIVQLQTLRSQIESSETQRLEAENALAALLGVPPGGLRIEPRPFSPFPVQTLRPEAPITLLAGRPDLRRAERNLRRADISVADARAAFLPSLSIGAAASARGDLRALADGLSSGWSLIADLLTTLLDDRSRQRNLERQRLAARGAVLDYRTTVISALQDVETALNAQNENLRQAEILALQLAAQEDAARQTEAQYRAGALSADDLVREQERLLNLRQSEVNLWAASVRAKLQLLVSFGVDPNIETASL